MKVKNYLKLLILVVLSTVILTSCKSSFPARGTPVECNGTFLTPKLNPTKRAEFIGGTSAFHEYLRANISHAEVLNRKIKGKVKVAFVVTKEGEICDVRITSKPKEYIDNEVIRVIKTMPKWIPGVDEGKTVDSYHLLHIKF